MVSLIKNFVGALLALTFVSVPAWSAPATPATPHPKTEAVTSASFSIYQRKPLRIGVITLSENPRTMQAIDETIERIRKVFLPYPVIIERQVHAATLEKAVKDGTVDVFIASAGFYWRLMRYGVISLATMITPEQPDPNHAVAVTYVVRKENPDIFTFEDMKGKTLSATFPTAFMSYRVGIAEIAFRGYPTATFFKNIHYYGISGNPEVLSRLDDGSADVAMIRACWLEGQPEDIRNKYRVINQQDGEIDCLHSTRTYPNLMIAVTQGAPPGAAHAIAREVLSMPHLNNQVHWGLATDLRSIDALQHVMQIEDYAYLRDRTFWGWIKTYRWYFLAIALLILVLSVHSWRVAYLVRRRTAELKEAMSKELESEKRAAAMRERMEKMQKSAAVGQLSNMIAHELSQPLAAVRYYCDGLKDVLAQGEPPVPILEMCRKGMDKAITRTQAIVDQVRNYSRGAVNRDQAVDLESAVSRVLTGFHTELLDRVHLSVQIQAGLHVSGNPLEIELLMNNLLKNAVEEAVEHTTEALVLCTAWKEPDSRVKIKVENSGWTLTQDFVDSIVSTPLKTTKNTGHGLGVAISLSIAEASGGHINFEPRKEGGMVVIVTLNAAPEK